MTLSTPKRSPRCSPRSRSSRRARSAPVLQSLPRPPSPVDLTGTDSEGEQPARKMTPTMRAAVGWPEERLGAANSHCVGVFLQILCAINSPFRIFVANYPVSDFCCKLHRFGFLLQIPQLRGWAIGKRFQHHQRDYWSFKRSVPVRRGAQKPRAGQYFSHSVKIEVVAAQTVLGNIGSTQAREASWARARSAEFAAALLSSNVAQAQATFGRLREPWVYWRPQINYLAQASARAMFAAARTMPKHYSWPGQLRAALNGRVSNAWDVGTSGKIVPKFEDG